MKHERYRQLVTLRKTCDVCAPGLLNPSTVDDGVYDSDHIGPYSRWQGNLDAKLVVIGQDFADVATFRMIKGWPGSQVKTNKRLAKLLQAAGIEVQVPVLGRPDDKVFLTNAVLCLKEGDMRAPVSERYFRACGQRFLAKLLALIGPKAVATLARLAGAKWRSNGILLPSVRTLASAAGHPFTLPTPTPIMVFPMYHPAASVSFENQRANWRRLGAWLTAT